MPPPLCSWGARPAEGQLQVALHVEDLLLQDGEGLSMNGKSWVSSEGFCTGIGTISGTHIYYLSTILLSSYLVPTQCFTNTSTCYFCNTLTAVLLFHILIVTCATACRKRCVSPTAVQQIGHIRCSMTCIYRTQCRLGCKCAVHSFM